MGAKAIHSNPLSGGHRPVKLAGALLLSGMISLMPAPSQAGGYVMPVIERIIPTMQAPAPAPAQGAMICGKDPKVCLAALLILLILLAASHGGDHDSTITPPIDRPPVPSKPEIPCVPIDKNMPGKPHCNQPHPSVPGGEPPPIAATPLPAGLLLGLSAFGILGAASRRRRHA